ncbi:MAG: amidohydrolase family protein, partial [Thermoanaerobacteraceae bacterium]|nr:amidohydrolase family protein [Thermoanaerobacteraceae bacterium]
MGGAYQEYMEDVRGSIEPGKVADFTVLDRDIFTIDPETIDQTKIVMTMVDGKVVYRTEL